MKNSERPGPRYKLGKMLGEFNNTNEPLLTCSRITFSLNLDFLHSFSHHLWCQSFQFIMNPSVASDSDFISESFLSGYPIILATLCISLCFIVSMNLTGFSVKLIDNIVIAFLGSPSYLSMVDTTSIVGIKKDILSSCNNWLSFSLNIISSNITLFIF